MEWFGPAQEKIPEQQRDSAAGANTLTLSGCVARGASTGTYTLTSNVKSPSCLTLVLGLGLAGCAGTTGQPSSPAGDFAHYRSLPNYCAMAGRP